MRGRLLPVFVLVNMASFTVAQETSVDPAAELAKKSEARAAARAALTQITVGELEDLRAQVRVLTAKNAALEEKLSALSGQQPSAEGRRFNEIEVGMTKEDLVAFVRRHSSTMRLGMFSSSAGGVKDDKVETIVTHSTQSKTKVDGSGNSEMTVEASGDAGVVRRGGTRTYNGRVAVTGKGSRQSDVDAEGVSKTTTEVLRTVAKRSSVVVTMIEPAKSGSTAVITDGSGRRSTVYSGAAARETGRLYVELEDDVVTSVRASTGVQSPRRG